VSAPTRPRTGASAVGRGAHPGQCLLGGLPGGGRGPDRPASPPGRGGRPPPAGRHGRGCSRTGAAGPRAAAAEPAPGRPAPGRSRARRAGGDQEARRNMRTASMRRWYPDVSRSPSLRKIWLTCDSTVLGLRNRLLQMPAQLGQGRGQSGLGQRPWVHATGELGQRGARGLQLPLEVGDGRPALGSRQAADDRPSCRGWRRARSLAGPHPGPNGGRPRSRQGREAGHRAPPHSAADAEPRPKPTARRPPRPRPRSPPAAAARGPTPGKGRDHRRSARSWPSD
jgi:hypothetical protein